MKKPLKRLFIFIVLFSFFVQAEYYLELWLYDELSSLSIGTLIFSYFLYVAFSFIHFTIIFGLDILIIRKIESRYPWDNYFLSRIGLEFFSTQTSAVLVTIPLTVYINYGLIVHYLNLPTEGLMISIYYNVVYIMAINLLFVVMYEGVFLFGEKKEIQLEKEQEHRARIMTQYQALKNQLNPHFLLNAMSALEEIIRKQPESALAFTQAFNKVFRNILELEDEPLISLRRELQFVNAYLYLQKTRFGECLKSNVSIDPAHLDRHLPPFALQLLVENAIKHNEISNQAPLTIHILHENGQLVVTNPLQPTARKEVSTRKGMANLTERYRMLGLAPPVLRVENAQFIAKISLV